MNLKGFKPPYRHTLYSAYYSILFPFCQVFSSLFLDLFLITLEGLVCCSVAIVALDLDRRQFLYSVPN